MVPPMVAVQGDVDSRFRGNDELYKGLRSWEWWGAGFPFRLAA